MKTVIGLFPRRESAEQVLGTLEEAGFMSNEVGVLAQSEAVSDVIDDERAEIALQNAGVGAVGGTALGGLIGLVAGASSLAVPGIGPALAGGAWGAVLGSAVAGAGLGAAYGGLAGALIGMGVEEERIHIYTEGVERGGFLVIVQPEGNRVLEAEAILSDLDGVAVGVVEEDKDKTG